MNNNGQINVAFQIKGPAVLMWIFKKCLTVAFWGEKVLEVVILNVAQVLLTC